MPGTVVSLYFCRTPTSRRSLYKVRGDPTTVWWFLGPTLASAAIIARKGRKRVKTLFPFALSADISAAFVIFTALVYYLLLFFYRGI